MVLKIFYLSRNHPKKNIKFSKWVIDVKKNKALPEFHGGLVGYFSYETIREIEGKLKESPKPKLKYDDISLMISDEVIIFDNIKKSLFIVVNGQEDEKSACLSRIDEIHDKLLEPSKEERKKTKNKINFSSSVSKKDYLDSIKKIKDYIIEGDVMQVVYGQELTTPFEGSPVELYKALRKLTPSPYMYFLKIDDLHIVGASPEILVRLQNNEVTVRPIAGTIKRGKNEKEDNELASI